MKTPSARLIIISSLMLAGVAPLVRGETPAKQECNKLLEINNGRLGRGLEKYSELVKWEDNEQILKVDISGDGKKDRLSASCSSSSEPADPCLLTLEVSGGRIFNKDLELHEGTYLIELNKKAYAIASTGTGKQAKLSRIFTFDKSGISEICRYK